MRLERAGEFVRIDDHEECSHPQNTRRKARGARQVCWGRGSDQRAVFDSQRKDSKLPRLPGNHQGNRSRMRASEIRIKRGCQGAVLIDPRSLNELRIDAKHLFAEHAKWATDFVLPCQDRIDFGLAQDSLSDQQFTESRNARINRCTSHIGISFAVVIGPRGGRLWRTLRFFHTARSIAQ